VRVFIFTDMEGVSGVDDVAQMASENAEVYSKSREKLMLDLNAAVAGAFDGGADYVIAWDGHGGRRMVNFIPDMLDKRCAYVDRVKEDCIGPDETFDAAFEVGYHAMAGTLNGFLDHTQSGLTIFNWYINGRRVGEQVQDALTAGANGVPLVMVAGDEAACAEARNFFGPIETAAVKQGVGRSKAIAYPPDEAHSRIRNAARRAMALVGKVKPLKPLLPMEVSVEYTRSDYCDAMAGKPGVERLDARTIRWVTSDQREWWLR
jgi:D-amino peptidase